MSPDSPFFLALTRKGYSDFSPFTRGNNSGNIYDEIVNKLFVASTTSRVFLDMAHFEPEFYV